MWKVVLKRFLVMIPQLFILSVLVFGLTYAWGSIQWFGRKSKNFSRAN